MAQFDLMNKSWTSLTTNNAGATPTPRQYSATAAINGSVFLFGGSDGELFRRVASSHLPVPQLLLTH